MTSGVQTPALLARGTYDSDSGFAKHAGRVVVFEDNNYTSTTPSFAAQRTGNVVLCKLVKNSSGAALLPKRAVVFKAGTNQSEVDGYSSTTAQAIAGIVDEFLPSAGVPDGSYFWIVQRGTAMLITDFAGASNAINEGDLLVALTAASSGGTLPGRPITQLLTGATSPLAQQIQNVFARALSARTTGNTNADLLAFVNVTF